MVVTNIEVVSQLPLGFVPEFQNLELTDLVCTGLTRHDDITLNFTGDITCRHTRIVDHISDCLFPGPAFEVNSRVDHQTNCTKQFALKSSQFTVSSVRDSGRQGEVTA